MNPYEHMTKEELRKELDSLKGESASLYIRCFAAVNAELKRRKVSQGVKPEGTTWCRCGCGCTNYHMSATSDYCSACQNGMCGEY